MIRHRYPAEDVLRKCDELEGLGVMPIALAHIRNDALRKRPDLAPLDAEPPCDGDEGHCWQYMRDRDGAFGECLRCRLRRFASPLPEATQRGGYRYNPRIGGSPE